MVGWRVCAEEILRGVVCRIMLLTHRSGLFDSPPCFSIVNDVVCLNLQKYVLYQRDVV